jgi:Copper type II ascorbate-dependent monooxygenase, C-terminal domain
MTNNNKHTLYQKIGLKSFIRTNSLFYSIYIGFFFLLLLLTGVGCKNKNSVPEYVTFTEDVAPILQQNCNQCHKSGGTAHSSYETYALAKSYSGAMAYVVKERLMPPWPADPNYTHFIGEKTLTDKEIGIILKWVQEGTPQGPPDKMPRQPTYPIGSTIGTPGMRLPVQPVLLKANSQDKFFLIKVPFEFPQDTFASLIEFMPGNRNVVHHVNGDMVKYHFEQKTNVNMGELVVKMEEDTLHLLQAFEKLGLPNDDGSYPVLQKSVVNYLPGTYGQIYPDGIGGYLLPRKGAFLLNDVHYGFTGKEDVLDSSYINIFFCPIPPKRPMHEFQLGTIGVSPVEPDMIIEPNTVKPISSRFRIPFDISIVTINPHMHLLGKNFKGYALTPAGDTIRLISIPRWDFAWQYFYTFPKMVHVPAGSTIVAEGVYDNTSKNLFNPFNPPQRITDQNGSMKATDEMFQFIISYLPYQAGDENISLVPKAGGK